MPRENSTNDMGWWSDPETVAPPYLEPEPGQAGECIHNYQSSQMGFASGAYPDGETVPDPVWGYVGKVGGAKD